MARRERNRMDELSGAEYVYFLFYLNVTYFLRYLASIYGTEKDKVF